MRLEIARFIMLDSTVSLTLLNFDRLRAANWVFVLSIWLAFAGISVIGSEGVFGPTFMAQIIPIATAGLVIGLRAAAGVALASAVLGLLIGPMNLGPSEPMVFVETSSAGRLFGVAFLFAAVVGLVAFVVGRGQDIVRALQSSEAKREERNQELRAEIRSRKQVEDELRQSEEHHRRISEMSSDLTFKYVIRKGQPPHQEWILGPCEKIVGWKPEELDADRWASIIVSGDEESFENRHRLFGTLGKIDSEFRIRRQDGEIRWISQQLRIVRSEDRIEIFGALRDITQRKLAEFSLEAERDFIAAVLENTAVMVVVADRDSRILRINESAAAFAGQSVQELHGTVALSLIQDEEARRVATDDFQRAVAGEEVSFELKGAVEADGKRRSAVWSTRSLREGGDPFVVVTGVDTTDQRIAEKELARHQEDLEDVIRERGDELARSQRRLVDSERLASVGTLAAGVAHQINNPIGAILMSSEYALMCEGESDEREAWRSALMASVEHAKRCGDIVRSILRFSAGERADKWPVDLTDLLRRVCRLTEVYAKEHSANLELSLDEEELSVLLSPIEMEEVFVNLIRNAIESRDGGVKVNVGVVRNGEVVVVTISDDGDGIESDQLKFVFDPFYTTRTSRGGTGLGLSVARGIVIDHAGQMNVQSPGAGRGTTVTVELPLYQDD